MTASEPSAVPETGQAGPYLQQPSRRQLRHGSDAEVPKKLRPWSVVSRVVSWVVLIVCAGLVVALVIVPRVTGSVPYTVLTGSMEPVLPPGTMVVVKPTDADDIRVGDILTYQLRSGRPEVVTHRVTGITLTPDGPRFTTQGDANDAPDPDQIQPEQIRGTAWYWIPAIGYFTSSITTDTRTWLARGIGVVLIGVALIVVVRTVLKSRRDARGEAHAASDAPFKSGPERLS